MTVLIGDPDVELIATLTAHAAAEAEAVSLAQRNGLQHAINCGHALLRIKEALPAGEWTAWAASGAIGVSRQIVFRYVRLARGAHLLEGSGVETIEQALIALRELPEASGRAPRRRRYTEEEIAHVRELVTAGVSLSDAAAEVGMKLSTAARYASAKSRRAHERRVAASRRQRERARRALQREEVSALARVGGDHLGAAYAAVRTALTRLEHCAMPDQTLIASPVGALPAYDPCARVLAHGLWVTGNPGSGWEQYPPSFVIAFDALLANGDPEAFDDARRRAEHDYTARTGIKDATFFLAPMVFPVPVMPAVAG